VPTLVEAIGLPALKGIDGRSLLALLRGEQIEDWRQQVYCAFNCMNGEEEYWPSRAMTTRRYFYLWSGWVDGKKLTKKVIHGGGGDEEEMFRRRFGDDWKHGIKEELYDIETDPGFWVNLIDDPKHQVKLDELRRALMAEMTATKDPEADRYCKENDFQGSN
jgi:arylsulfatase A-like enzyme